jgi:hypothetical protein
METASAVNPVVVGVDGPEQSLAAVDWATDEAEMRTRSAR